MKAKILLVTLMFPLSLWAGNYGQMARDNVPSLLEKSIQKLESFERTTPMSEVKILRKDFGKAKIMLDVFAYAYSKKDGDLWKRVRKKLDKGYELIGDYKDLFDISSVVEVDEEEADRRFLKAKKWSKKFVVFYRESKVKNYLSNSLIDLIAERSGKELPKFLWRRLSYKPSPSVEGTDVLYKMMANALLSNLDLLNEILAYKDLLAKEREENFHDFRKGIRTLLYVNDLILDENIGEFDTLSKMVDKFGKLNDLLVAYHRKPSKKIEKKIKSKWKHLKRWLKEKDISSVINRAADHFNR